VMLTFYANDTLGHTNSAQVTIYKDNTSPIIEIIAPLPDQLFQEEPPSFEVEISDPNLDVMWYTLNNSTIRYYFIENGTIDQDAWNALTDFDIVITFYARDQLLNTGFKSINIMKNYTQTPGDDPNPNDGGLPPLDLIPIIVISIIIISAIILTGILIRGAKKKSGLPKKSKNLTEKQLADAQYFKDVTSILIIIAIHKDSGLALSKIAFHEGNGLDEDLFTGFISAMGSFKNELAKQMGLRVREEGGDNVIQYNEFTITVMDGEFLRLGLVSHSNLGPFIKQQCAHVLRDYEIKHMDKLKNFDGEILTFKDFEAAIESGLNMNLNKKFGIDIKQLNKYDASVPLKTILHEINLKSNSFYLVEISTALIQKNKLSEHEANFMVYEAYKHGVLVNKS